MGQIFTKVKKLEIKGHICTAKDDKHIHIYTLYKIRPLKKVDLYFLKWKNVQVEKQVA